MTSSIRTGITARRGSPDASDFGKELDYLQTLGLEAVEVPTHDLDVVAGGRILRPAVQNLREACLGRDLVYSVHGPLGINFMHDAYRLPRQFEVLKASIEVAAEIGAVHYVVHSGLTEAVSHAAREDAYARQREWLAKAGEIAAAHNVILCVESLFGAFDGTVKATPLARLARELTAIDHPHVRATLDVSHGYLGISNHGGDFLEGCAALAPFARHVHIHDSFGRPDDIWLYTEGERLAFGHGDLHLPVGWGDIPWDAVIEACTFPQGAIFNIELRERYWYAVDECVAATKALAARAQVEADTATPLLRLA